MLAHWRKFMIDAIDLGSSAIQGLVLGVLTAFLFKIATNIIKFLIVGQFLLFKWLESRNIIIVDWHRLTFGLTQENDLAQQAESFLNSLLETGTFGIAAVAGFFLVNRFSKQFRLVKNQINSHRHADKRLVDIQLKNV